MPLGSRGPRPLAGGVGGRTAIKARGQGHRGASWDNRLKSQTSVESSKTIYRYDM